MKLDKIVADELAPYVTRAQSAIGLGMSEAEIMDDLRKGGCGHSRSALETAKLVLRLDRIADAACSGAVR